MSILNSYRIILQKQLITLLFFVTLAMFLSACGSSQPKLPSNNNTHEITLSIPALGNGITPQGIPFDDEDNPVVQHVKVDIINTGGTVQTSLSLSPSSPSKTIEILQGTYIFKAKGFDQNSSTKTWLAYGETSQGITAETTVSLPLFSLIDSALLSPSAPISEIIPGQSLDLILSVVTPLFTANVPLANFEVDYSTPDGSIKTSSKRGVRFDVSSTPSSDVFNATTTVTGWQIVDGSAIANGNVTGSFSRPFAGGSSSGNGTFITDLEQPTLSVNTVANANAGTPITLSGSADDNMGLDRIQIYDGVVLIASSHSEDNQDPTVSNIGFTDLNWSTIWIPDNAQTYNLTVTAIDSSGNQREKNLRISVGTGSGGSTPTPPSNIVATPQLGSIELNWQDNSDNETGFAIFREQLGSALKTVALTQIATVDADTTTYTDIKVNENESYTYAVAALQEGSSPPTPTPQSNPPVQPDPPLRGACDTTPTPTDSDGDGLSDADEIAGWTVFIDQSGQNDVVQRVVTSNPNIGDSDNDKVCDFAEKLSGTDPNSSDTDGDTLTDFDEINIWASSPTNVDSDGDATERGQVPFNNALRDGSEVVIYKTSPTTNDSDGDGISDYKEIIELGNNFEPLIANIPQLEMYFTSDPVVDLDITLTSNNTVAKTISTTLEQGSESSLSTTDSSSHEVTAEASFTFGQEYEVSASASLTDFGVSSSVTTSWEASVTAGYTYNNATSTTETAVQNSREAYSDALEESRTEGQEISGGKLTVTVKLENVSDISLNLGDLEISALIRNPNKPSEFRPLTTLLLSVPIQAGGIGMAPGDSTGNLIATGNLTAQQALDVLADPNSLSLEISNVTLSYQNPDNRSPRALLDFAFLKQETNAKTAFVQVDFGNGTVIRERIATNVNRENGNIVGVPMSQVMEILGLTYVTATSSANGLSAEVLASVDDPNRNTPLSNNSGLNYAWVVVGDTTNTYPAGTSFEDIVLLGGDALYLIYAKDEDKDTLFAREEYFYGTSDTNPDSDNDTLTDGFEIKEGWQAFIRSGNLVPPVSPYNDNSQVFSDPTRTDIDGDGLNDAQERNAGTDPNNPDTDGDDFCDGDGLGTTNFACPNDADPDPLDPSKTGNAPPVIDTFSLQSDGLLSTVIASASDANDNIVEVVVDWGDGNTSNLTENTVGFNGFNNIRLEHIYSNLGTFTVTLTVRDDRSESVSQSINTDSATPRSGLLAEYLFTNISSSNTGVTDSSSNGNDGHVKSFFDNSGGCVFNVADRFGFAKRALNFWSGDVPWDGGCGLDYEISVSLPHLALDDELTLTFWLDPGSNGWLIGQTDANDPFNESKQWMSVNSGVFKLRSHNGNILELNLPSALSNTWTFYAITVTRNGNTTTTKIYSAPYQGTLSRNPSVEESGNGDYSNPSSTDGIYIGGLPNTQSGDFYRGLVDNIRIFDRGLSYGEILALFITD